MIFLFQSWHFSCRPTTKLNLNITADVIPDKLKFMFLFPSLSPILINVKHCKQQPIIYYSWTSLVCIVCHTFPFLPLPSLPRQQSIHTGYFWSLEEEIWWLCYLCRNRFWQTQGPLFNVCFVCPCMNLSVFYVYKGLQFLFNSCF